MARQAMLTTMDNPYDPFTQFDEWYMYDELHGYHSSGLVGRIANTSIGLSNADNSVEIENAIDEIIKYDPTLNYKKVVKEI